MFSHHTKSVRHAIELLPTHIRRAQPKYRRSNLRAKGRVSYAPGGIYSLLSHRNQRSVVKISYSKNTKTRSWAAHGEYLQREHAQTRGEKGLGFNYESNAIDIKTKLREWQKEDDSHFFKLIVSPEHGHKLDLKQHAKDLMEHVQKDLRTKLEWVAIDHHNTDHPHLHVLIRGVDERGKELVIERDYLSHGFRHHSQELATRVLGIRLEREITLSRERQLEHEYVTSIDRSIIRKAENSIVNYHKPVSDNLLSRDQRLLEIRRLNFLETLGLAEQVTAKAWKIKDDLEIKLHQMRLSNDIIESRARHNITTLTHEIPIPTQIHERKPLTGKVVGMGLENELKDQRYLLLEGIDGKVHYIQATNSIVKARDNFEFSNNDIITLEKKKFVNRQRETIEYLKIQNHFSLEKLQCAPHSRLDRDVIDFVKTHGVSPQNNFPDQSFAHEYANSMIKRFQELERDKVLVFEKGHYHLASDWEKKLSHLAHQRQSEFTRERNTNSYEQYREYSLSKQYQFTLDDIGELHRSRERNR
jgi:type IV secretory pathway VirD2 relaxase